MRPSPITVFVCLVGIVLAGAGLYLGALLPLVKAQSYISAQRQVASVHTVTDFENVFNGMFDLYSPVGTEEVTKFLAGDILNIIGGGQSEAVSREVVQYMEPHLFKDDVRHLLLLGQMYQTLWQQYGKDPDYQTAISYYEKAHEIGPQLPPPLYSLLGLYVAHGDTVNTKATARLILALWPDDAKVQTFLK